MVQNPNYYMPYQQPMPYQQNNPYLERINNLQQYQQTLQPQQTVQSPMINGKVVDSIEVVKATDIPMDGNVFYFPKADGTELYSKQWLANGTTRILKFKPVLDDNTANPMLDDLKSQNGAFNTFIEDIMKRFDNLESRLDELKKPTTTKTTSRSKKENETE